MNKVIMLYGEKVICIGNIIACKNYISQLYEYSIESVTMLPYDSDHYLYEDYELVRIKEYDLYLTIGEVNLMKESCKEEQSSVKFIQDELDKLMGLNMFSVDLMNEMSNMKDTLERIKREHVRYLNNSLFDNLDLDALHTAHVMERENKGLPSIYII